MRIPAAILLLSSLIPACAAADADQLKAVVKLAFQGSQQVVVDGITFKTSKGIGDQLALFDQFGTRFNVTASLRPDGSIALIRIERLTPGSSVPEPVVTVPCVLAAAFDPLQVHGLVVPTVVEADRADAVQANLGGGGGGGGALGTTPSTTRGSGPGFSGGGAAIIVPPITKPSPN